jgi:exonuclease VII large subunit
VLLKGAAADTRNAQTQDAAQRVAAASKGRQVARKPVVQARQQVKAQQKQVRQLQKRIKNDDVRHPKHAQRRLANMREQLQASRADLRQAKKSRVSSVTKQRAAYSGLVGAGTQPLAPLATQIGIDAGEDPFRVQGLFDPVTASSLNTNDADELKRQGGLLATFGAPPKYGTYGAARKIGLAKQGMKGDKKVQAVRGGNLYRELTQNIEDDLAKNTPAATIIANISRATVPVYNKKGKQVGTEPLGKRHQNLVKLVMLDYAPALGAR